MGRELCRQNVGGPRLGTKRNEENTSTGRGPVRIKKKKGGGKLSGKTQHLVMKKTPNTTDDT